MNMINKKIESQAFYELMQIYRHTPYVDQKKVMRAYDNVKKFLIGDQQGKPQSTKYRTISEGHEPKKNKSEVDTTNNKNPFKPSYTYM